MWWDTGDLSENKNIPPYHYVRTQAYTETHDLLIIGGEDHPTGIASDKKINEGDRYSLLEYWARIHFPEIEEIVYQWSGQVMEPSDSIAYIGKNPLDKNNVYIITGDSGNGITHGTIAGILISDMINGRENEWIKVYDPARFKIFSVGTSYIKELKGNMLGYFKRKSADTDYKELGTIHNNEGKIIQVEGEKFAAFRDDLGKLHFMGSDCQHLGCTVKWNNDEKTWDCPCHGSRYSAEGKVINGPANEDLVNYTSAQPKQNLKHENV